MGRGTALIAGILLGVAFGFLLAPKLNRVPAGSSAPSPPSVRDDCAHEPSAFHCVKFDHNYDGDTITFQIPDVHPLIGRDISVRVYGIDTPEIKGKGPCEKDRAKEAKELVKGLLSRAKRIDLVNLQRDKYFRILAEVKADGVSVSEKLIEAKLAYPYGGGTKEKINWCQLARK